MYLSTIKINSISIILSTLLIMVWIINAVVEIAKIIIDLEIARIDNALEKDMEGFYSIVGIIEEGTSKTKEFLGNTADTVKEGLGDTATKIKKFFHKNS